MVWSPTEVGGVCAIAYVSVKEIGTLARAALARRTSANGGGPPPLTRINPSDAQSFWDLQTGIDGKINRLLEMHVTMVGLMQTLVQQNSALVASVRDLSRKFYGGADSILDFSRFHAILSGTRRGGSP